MPERRPKGDTLEWLCNQYFHSTEFRNFADNTKRNKRSLFSALCAEKLNANGTGPEVGSLPYAPMAAKHIRMLRDRRNDTPAVADGYVKQLSALFRWAIEQEHMTANPARDVPRKRASGDGFHTWTVEEVRQYERCHPVGTQARLALALHMFTGQRKSDGIMIGPKHRTPDGRLVFTQQKNKTRDPIHMDIPLLPELADIIAATTCGMETYLINEAGKPWTLAGFGNKFREWCNQAGLSQCTSHGLRKAAAVTAAENGATEHQMMSIFGWKNPDQARVYTQKAKRAKMAGDSMHLIANRPALDRPNVSHL